MNGKNNLSTALMHVLEDSDEQFNKDIGDGLSRHYIEQLPSYLDEVFVSAMQTLPPEIGLTYEGYKKLTPAEDYYNNITSSMSKNIIDISRNFLYKMEYRFIFNKIPINRIIALPYVERGGYLRLSDAHYAMVPVLSEYPVSPAPGELFVRILRDKLNIKKMYRNTIKNGEVVPIQVIFSKSYKLIERVNDVVPIALYAFIKYGFYGVFKEMFNTKPILLVGPVPINAVEDEYDIYTTTGVKPRTLSVLNYQPHEVTILIKKTDNTPVLETYVASLIYSFDMSPLFAMDVKRSISDNKPVTTIFDFNDIDDESLYWITLLGKIIFKNKYTIDRIQVDILEHINILNGYLDSIVKKRLLDIDVKVDDFYELLDYCIHSFNDLVMKHESYSSKLDNRYIDLPYYVLFDIIVAINKAFLEIKRSHQRNRITDKEITRIFNKYLFTKKVFKLIKGNGVNLAVNPVENTTDNYYHKLTSVLEDFWSSLNLANCGNVLKLITTTYRWKRL